MLAPTDSRLWLSMLKAIGAISYKHWVAPGIYQALISILISLFFAWSLRKLQQAWRPVLCSFLICTDGRDLKRLWLSVLFMRRTSDSFDKIWIISDHLIRILYRISMYYWLLQPQSSLTTLDEQRYNHIAGLKSSYAPYHVPRRVIWFLLGKVMHVLLCAPADTWRIVLCREPTYPMMGKGKSSSIPRRVCQYQGLAWTSSGRIQSS